MNSDRCLVYDIGGTKIEVAVLNSQAGIELRHRECVQADYGKDFFVEQLIRLGKNYLQKFPDIQKIGIASCGPLDPGKGILQDPTNLLTHGQSWGQIPLKDILQTTLEREVRVDNDAACAVLAERWLGLGTGQKRDNIISISLGTGLGIGIICNGKLLRAGRNLHPEAGHIIIDFRASSPVCACGAHGDSESFLSGSHFVKNFQEKNRISSFSNEEIIKKAQEGDELSLIAFRDFSEVLAVTLHNLCVMFCPEQIIFTGGFAKSYDLFAKQTDSFLKKLLIRRSNLVPELMLSKLAGDACLLGAASLCFERPN